MIYITSASGRQWQTEDAETAATFVAECGFTYTDKKEHTKWLTQKVESLGTSAISGMI